MKEKARSDREVCISIGKIEGEAQVTSNDTGWSEEEKERMRQAGYDDMDIQGEPPEKVHDVMGEQVCLKSFERQVHLRQRRAFHFVDGLTSIRKSPPKCLMRPVP